MKPSNLAKTFRRVYALLTLKEQKELWLWVGAKTLVAVVDFTSVAALGVVLISSSSSLANSEILSGISQLPEPGSQNFLYLLILVLALFLLKTLMFYFSSRGMLLFLSKLETNHSVAVAQTVLSDKLDGLQKFSEAELQWAVNRSTQVAFSNFLGVITGLVSDLVIGAMILFLFFLTNPHLATLLAIYFASLFMTFQIFTNSRLRRHGIRLRDSQVELTGVVHSIPLAFREMIVMRRESFFLEKLRKAKKTTTRAQAHYTVISSLPRQFFEIGLITGVLVVLLASFQLDFVTLDPLTFGVFAAGTLRLMGLFLPLQRGISNLNFIAPQADESLKILETKLGLRPPGVSINSTGGAALQETVDSQAEGVSLSNVTFRYPDSTTDVLKGVSFEIQPREFVVLTGSSGAGKSTLLEILLGLRAPTRGLVRIGRHGLSSDFAPRVRLVSQSIGIIPGTILENISLGSEVKEAQVSRAQEVARQVGLSRVIEDLPDGLHSDLGKHADKLSGGQLQRLSLARALFDRPQLLVLDEPTSALDSDSEQEIGDLLLALRAETTIIAVSHKPQLVKIADRSFSLVDGVIREQ